MKPGLIINHNGKPAEVIHIYRGHFSQLPQVNIRQFDLDGKTIHFFHGVEIIDVPLVQ